MRRKITIGIEEETHSKLKTIAEKHKRSMGATINLLIIREHLKLVGTKGSIKKEEEIREELDGISFK